MGFLRTRTPIASPLSREHSPVKWYAAPLSINGFPFRFPRSQETLRKIIRACTRASSCVDPLYLFKCITFPNRYWKESVGWPRARPVGLAPDCLNYQLQHLVLARVPGLKVLHKCAKETSDILSRRIREGKMTMSGDMLFVMHDAFNFVQCLQARAESEEPVPRD